METRFSTSFMNMKMRIYLPVLLLLLSFNLLTAQDTLIYHQADALKFSNEYHFYSNGSFEHILRKDDFAIYYGSGTFKENEREFSLQFRNDPYLKVEAPEFVTYTRNVQRLLQKKGKKLISPDYDKTSETNAVVFVLEKKKKCRKK